MKKLNVLISSLFFFPPLIAMDMESEYVKPRDFSHAEQRVDSYLQEHGLIAEAKEAKKAAVSSLLKDLDFLNDKGAAKVFDFALWHYQDVSQEILNEDRVDFKCDQLCQRLKTTPPTLQITGFAGMSPLGGLRGESSDTVPLYGILKFIGQHTKNRNQFDKSIATVQQIRESVKGRISNPDEVLFLMAMNRNFVGTYTFPRPAHPLFHKKRDFKESIYKPTPSTAYEWNHVKIRLRKALELNPSVSAKILVIKSLLNDTFGTPNTINELVSDRRQKLIIGSDACTTDTAQLQAIAVDIMSRSYHPKVENPEAEVESAANTLVEGLELQDSVELTDIVFYALLYVKDNNLLSLDSERAVKKLAFEKLFTQSVVPADSDMAHYAIRRAAQKGCEWALQFLIKNGVSVNPPAYRQWRQWLYEEDTKTPLELAKGHEEAINILRNAGAK